MIAALILVYRDKGKQGVIELLKRSFDFKRIVHKRWYVVIFLTMPIVTILSFMGMYLTGVAMPHFQIAVFSLLGLSAAFFIANLGEELGWSGYALEPLQARWGALPASLVLGLVWAAYHYVALLQVHRSITWIAWWTLYTVAARVIMVWFFNHTGHSVFGMTLFHMMLNVTWQIYPVSGSSFAPQITGIILAIVAVIVISIWGPSLHTMREIRSGT